MPQRKKRKAVKTVFIPTRWAPKEKAQIKREAKATGHTASGLLRVAWQYYLNAVLEPSRGRAENPTVAEIERRLTTANGATEAPVAQEHIKRELGLQWKKVGRGG